MQTEQTGDTNSKVPVAQQPQKKKKKSAKKPKPASTTGNKENSSLLNEEAAVDGAQTINPTIKKKKKRNNNKKKLITTAEKTENLISQTFKATKLQNPGSELNKEPLLNSLEQNSLNNDNTNSGENEEQSQKTLNCNPLLKAIAKVGSQENSEQTPTPTCNSVGASNSTKSKKKRNRNLNNSSSHSSTESPSKPPNKSIDVVSASTTPVSSKSKARKNSENKEKISKSSEPLENKSSGQEKARQGLEQQTKRHTTNPNTRLVEVSKSKQEISNNNSSESVPMEVVQKDKSREEILAAREAKKLAKQQEKKRVKNNVNVSTVKTEETHNLANKINASPVKNVDRNDVSNTSTNEINLETINSLQKSKIPGGTAEQKKIEKSREEILAEREAKKLAKQAAKNKSKNKEENVEQTKIIRDTKEPEQKKESLSTDETDFTNNKIVNIENLANKLENIQTNAFEGQKKKPTTKAERRAIQEAQREAKAKLLAEKQQSQKAAPAKGEVPKKEVQAKCVPTENRKTEKPATITSPSKPRPFKVKFFNQLEAKLEEQNLFVNNPQIHPAMVKLGEQYAKRIVVGSNARCIAFLNALKMVIEDYVTPPKKEFSRGLEASIKNCVDHLQKCRPLAVSVSNAYKYIKVVLTKLPPNQPESELKKHLVELIDIYIKDQIEKAAQAISYNVLESISAGDVILTYGCSSLITHILEEAHRKQIDFRVIVVDSRPFSEGQELLRRLVAKGISCTCVLINAIGFVMPDVTKVLLGAHALLANGYVVSRIGTAQVALVARSFNVSVFVCCEKHKFSERTQTDAIVYNELGNPNDLISKTKNCRLMDWKSFPSLYPLNLNYDVTPPELVNVVVTEVTLMPSTSAPVILRIRPNEMLS